MGEGKLARRVAFYSLLILVVWGSKELAIWLRSFNWAEPTILGGFKVPFYALPTSSCTKTRLQYRTKLRSFQGFRPPRVDSFMLVYACSSGKGKRLGQN